MALFDSTEIGSGIMAERDNIWLLVFLEKAARENLPSQKR